MSERYIALRFIGYVAAMRYGQIHEPMQTQSYIPVCPSALPSTAFGLETLDAMCCGMIHAMLSATRSAAPADFTCTYPFTLRVRSSFSRRDEVEVKICC